METVAGEKPLELATSLMVTAADLADGRFTGLSVAASSGGFVPLGNGGGCFIPGYSAGNSKDSGFLNQLVFQIPKAIPSAIHTDPRIFAGTLKLHHKPRQMKKPRSGGTKFTTFFCPCTK